MWAKRTINSVRRCSRVAGAVKKGIPFSFLLISYLLFSPRLLAEDLVRVIREQHANEAQLHVVNDGIVEATISFKFDLDNARLDTKRRTLVVGPGEQVRAFTITRKKIDKSWRYQYNYRWRWGRAGVRPDKSYVYRMPFEEGRKVVVGQGFNGNFSHGGEQKYAIDWMVPEGTPVHAARGGRVVAVESRFLRGGPSPNFLHAANYVVVMHDDGTFGNYLHFQQDGVVVQMGDYVRAGQLIGYSGNTGFSTEPHLHFHVYAPTDDWESDPIKIRFTTEEGHKIILKKGKTYTSK